MSFLIDNDICSAYLRGNGKIFSRFGQYGGRIYLSVVSLAELFVWAHRAPRPQMRRQGIQGLLHRAGRLDVDESVAARFGEIRAHQFSIGQFTPALDLLIASTALVHGLALVTHNVQDYAAVPGLAVVDWLAP